MPLFPFMIVAHGAIVRREGGQGDGPAEQLGPMDAAAAGVVADPAGCFRSRVVDGLPALVRCSYRAGGGFRRSGLARGRGDCRAVRRRSRARSAAVGSLAPQGPIENQGPGGPGESRGATACVARREAGNCPDLERLGFLWRGLSCESQGSPPLFLEPWRGCASEAKSLQNNHVLVGGA